MEESLLELTRILRLYIYYILLLVGTFGNVMSLVLLTKTKMGQTSAGVYFVNMAVGDIIYLTVGITDYIYGYHNNGVHIIYEHPWSCKIVRYVQFVAGDTSFWILLAITCDRFFAVVKPYYANLYCTVAKAKTISLLIWILSACLNIHSFWTRGLSVYQEETSMNATVAMDITDAQSNITNTKVIVRNCGFPTEAARYFEYFVRPWINLIFLALLPSVIICAMNYCIIKVLRHRLNRRKDRLGHSKVGDQLQHLTTMLFVVSVEYLVLIPPNFIFLLIRPYLESGTMLNVAQNIMYTIAYIHHSINFYLWCVAPKAFRSAFCLLIRCKEENIMEDFVMNSNS